MIDNDDLQDIQENVNLALDWLMTADKDLMALAKAIAKLNCAAYACANLMQCAIAMPKDCLPDDDSELGVPQ